MKILLADAVHADCARLLRAAGFEVDDRPGLSRPEQIEAVADIDGLVVRSATQVDQSLLEAAPNLRVVGRAGSGVDNIDIPSATSSGVLVMNAPGENTLAAAEHAIAMLLALCRNIAPAHRTMREGSWDRKRFMGVELRGKTLGVVGMGRIGRTVAEAARGLGMNVLGYDPFLPPEQAGAIQVELLPLDDLLPLCDLLTLHAPRTERTTHLIDADALALCKKGVRLVNCARGGIVDESALMDAIDSGHVAGAALDVFEQEPLPTNHPLRSHEGILLTPHLGASTVEAQEKVATRIAEQMVGYLHRGVVQNAVNMVSVDGALAERLQPFQQLARSMGALQAELLDGRYEEMAIEVAGEAAELPLAALSAAAIEGLLGGLLSQRVNLVNAPSVAEQQGYRWSQSVSPDTDGYAGLLTVRVRSDGGQHLLSGAVFGHRYPKIVRIDDFFVETSVAGQMLLVENDDTPGQLAAITAVIAESGVNVANLALGRCREQGRALATFRLDSGLPETALAALETLPGVARVRHMRLGDGIDIVKAEVGEHDISQVAHEPRAS